MMELNIDYEGEKYRIYAKLEMLNPSGSVKDRIAFHILKRAEERGLIGKDSIIVEATSGNTGIGLAMACAVKDYRCIIVMPEHMSRERIKIMENLGAEICLTPKEEGFTGARQRTVEMAAKNPKIFLARQFENPDNIEVHYLTTGKEILTQMEDIPIHAFVDGVGTGGTLMGVRMALKEVYPEVKIVAVEPAEAAILSGEKEIHDHKIAGIGDGFIPELLDLNQVDRIICIHSDDAIMMTKTLSKCCGLMVGISSGANVLASINILDELGKDKNVVTVFPDRAERYFSTDLYPEQFCGAVRQCTKNCETPYCDFKYSIG